MKEQKKLKLRYGFDLFNYWKRSKYSNFSFVLFSIGIEHGYRFYSLTILNFELQYKKAFWED